MTTTDVSSKISAGLPVPYPLPQPLPQDQTRPSGPLFFPYGARESSHFLMNTEKALTLSDEVIERAREHARKHKLQRVTVGTSGLVMDVEFRTQDWHGFWTSRKLERRHGVTLQCRGIVGGQDRIFDHPQHALHAARTNQILRHRVALQESCDLEHPEGCLAIDYFRAEGWHTALERAPWKEVRSLPIFQLAIYGHYLLAELYMIFAGKFLADIDARVRAREIHMGRRLRCSQKRHDSESTTPGKTQPPFDFVSLPWILTLDKWRFAVEICFLDTAGLHGPISLDKLCENVGRPLRYKKLVKRNWITRMHELYWAYPDLFDAYSLEDLLVYEALLLNRDSMQRMYGAMGLGSRCPKEPKGTMGKFSQVCFQAMLDNETNTLAHGDGKDQRDAILSSIRCATANYLASFVHSTRSLLAKVEGGRCWCHRPDIAYLLGPLVDIDISSCYGAGLALQVFPIGTPMFLDFDKDSAYNEYPTLRVFREDLGYDLVPGLWHARVSLDTDKPLKYPQDFLGSWFDYKEEDTREQLLVGAEDKDEPLQALTVRSGCLKILSHHIRDAVITGDFFEWLDHVCSPAQRDELLDRLVVKAALYYPKNDKKPTLDQLALDKDAHQGTNTCRIVRVNGRLRRLDQKEDYYGWYGLSLGTMGVSILLQLRKQQPKGTPLDQLLKLTINALYGDSVSQYFDTSNMCVGNNITARARAMAWYMEKGLYMVQTITDGGVFELNKILYTLRRAKIDACKTMGLSFTTASDMQNRLHLEFAPLGTYDDSALPFDNITLEWDTPTEEHPKFKYHIPHLVFWQNGVVVDGKVGTDALHWIDTTALAHLQQLFPHATVLKQFVFETKLVYEWGTFQGAANYYLHHPDPEQAVTKMRSYEREKEYHTLDLVKNALIQSDFYQDTTPARKHLGFLTTPTRVPPALTFVKEVMLKDGEYRVRYKDPDEPTNQHPGGSLWKAGLFREFNLSQYHYVSEEQFKKIKAQWAESKRKYGQYVEMLFRREDGLLDHQTMIIAVDKAIRSGVMNLMDALDPHYAIRRELGDRMYHPAYHALAATRIRLAQSQGLAETDAEEHESHMDTSWDHIPYELLTNDSEAAD